MPLSVFESYSHRDEAYRNELAKHLKMLTRSGIINEWHDRRIVPGTEWEAEIMNKLNSADIVLLLISPDFIDSEFCYSKEMGIALERHAKGEAVVIPILVRPVNFSRAPFAKLQMLPRDALAVSMWSDRDEAWVNVSTGIERAIDTLLAKREDGRLSRNDRHEQKQPGNSGEIDVTGVTEEVEPSYVEEKPSYVLFWERMCDAFPGIRDVQEFTDPEEACDRLMILLHPPLLYRNGGDPFWWIGRGNNSIERFVRLGPDRILMFPYEVKIRRIAAVRSIADLWRDFVYVETEGEQPVGIYSYEPGELVRRRTQATFDPELQIQEEYGLWNGHPITRAEYDDGAAMIDGKPVRTSGAALRVRFLSSTNFIICGKRHVVNQIAADRFVRATLNGILQGTMSLSDLVDVVRELPLPRSYEDPTVW